MEKELLQRFDKLVDSLGDMGGHVYDLARNCDTDSMAHEEDKTISFVLCGIVSVVAGAIAVAMMFGGIRRLVNPEWYALQEIARSLGLQ